MDSGTSKHPLLPEQLEAGEMETYGGSAGGVLSKDQIMCTGPDGLDEHEVAE